MLGEGKKSGIINRSLLYDEFRKTSLGGLIWDVFGSLSALIILMAHIPFNQCLDSHCAIMHCTLLEDW